MSEFISACYIAQLTEQEARALEAVYVIHGKPVCETIPSPYPAVKLNLCGDCWLALMGREEKGELHG